MVGKVSASLLMYDASLPILGKRFKKSEARMLLPLLELLSGLAPPVCKA